MSNIRSCIKPAFKKKMLLQGSWVAGLGAILLVLTAVFMPVATLKFWGFPIFVFAILFITFGLLPYRKLTRLELNPDVITMQETQCTFTHRGCLLFTIPYAAIHKMEYLESSHDYGIGIWFYHPSSPKVIVYPKACVKNYQNKRCKEEADLFLPYFSQKGFEELKEVWLISK